MSDKFIVITTINPPGEAVTAFSEWKDWQLLIVGDRKTPEECYRGFDFLGMKEQVEMFGEFADNVPKNSYARKMFGYAHAIRQGARVIFETDDDNIPYRDSENVLNEIVDSEDRTNGERVRSGHLFLNVYEWFGVTGCWPRGFPLENLKDFSRNKGVDDKPWRVMQFLTDGDPDVDAIFRIFDGRRVYFARDRRFIPDAGTYCPINSQSTIWTPKAFPLMFLPVGVSDRVTDILRGYIAQSCLWNAGRAVAFSSPIGFQNRNSHDLIRDFSEEIPLYLNANKWCRELSETDEVDLVNGYLAALEKLVKLNVLPEKNLTLYDGFLSAAGIG